MHETAASSLIKSSNGELTIENSLGSGGMGVSEFTTPTVTHVNTMAAIDCNEQPPIKLYTHINIKTATTTHAGDANEIANLIVTPTTTHAITTTTPHCNESSSALSSASAAAPLSTIPIEAYTDSAAASVATTANAQSGVEETVAVATPISDFYRNATILITGGTGFVGKVLTQKLLRAFELRRIYMLIRCKNDVCVEERLANFLRESIFDAIRAEQPELLQKVHAVRVDYSALDLGISPEDREKLCEDVEIVFNVVASVKFNEKLSDAIDINVLGTKKILDLSMEMKNLKSFVHISTLYCNCNRKYIKERVYESDIGYEKIMQIFRIFDDETLEKFRHCLIGGMPNTYTMTKKCAENLVNHRAFFMPAGIFRPPIVMSTYKDPFPGWTDNLYGPSGLCTWSARGLVRCIYGRANCKANMVPADYCVNA
ncbi:unnamed protein product [Ceratitis capitata]|uniref:Fatty acyl-CoA reductase n=1 Tax=Ceratitis capitata TaxID=7213 RepID=A0A811V4M9_CERCA|nr:unnamed protein product [Ceratitis capitata]